MEKYTSFNLVSSNRLGMDMGIIRIPAFRRRCVVDPPQPRAFFIVKFLVAPSSVSFNMATNEEGAKRTPTSVRRRSSRVHFRLRNPSSPDVVFVMKALFSILDPQNRVETNTCFVFAHDFVLALRFLHFSPLFTYTTDNYNVETPPRNL